MWRITGTLLVGLLISKVRLVSVAVLKSPRSAVAERRAGKGLGSAGVRQAFYYLLFKPFILLIPVYTF